MTRRDLVNAAVRAAAAAGGQEFFAAWSRAADSHSTGHSTAPPEPDRWSNYQPAFFSADEFAALARVTEILIPTDDTPGAREAHVAHYTDFVVHAAAEDAPELQREWRAAVQWLTGKKFTSLTAGQQTALLEAMSLPERDRKAHHDGYFSYDLIKQMTVFAFYTSRAGLVDDLEYKGNAYLTEFPGCRHPEHQEVRGHGAV